VVARVRGATVAAAGCIGVAVATVGDPVAVAATDVGAPLGELELMLVLGAIPAGVVRGWQRLAGFSEVTSSLAGGCDVGGVVSTVAAAGLLLLAGATDTGINLETEPTEALGTTAAEEVGGITEGVVGGDGTTAAGVAFVVMLLSGTLCKATGLLSGLGTLFGGVSVPELSVELDI